MKPYYLMYEDRYKKAYEAGMEMWGHTSADETLYSMLSKFVADNKLHGKRVIDFACGEGAGGGILSQLGCIYYGVDISPTAIEKARTVLKKYPQLPKKTTPPCCFSVNYTTKTLRTKE